MGGARLSLERLSFDVGLSTKTISRVLSRDMLVDLRTLEQLFASLDIILSDDDYVRAENAEDPTNVFPQPRSAFFGRREQLGRLRMLLVEKRSVTLAGTGGVGKTRLAIEAASRFGDELFDRVAYCDLAVVTEASLVAATVARAFGVRPDKRAPGSTLAQIVDGDRVLLLIDNCEHMLLPVAVVADDLLRALPRLVVFATSREPIGLEGEVVLRLPPLAVPVRKPMSVAEALAHPAIALFVDRACEVDDDFAFDDAAVPVTLEIVARVEAIPLAIELAASRVATSVLPEIAQSLRDHMSALATESTSYGARHRSIRALVDWSYELLDDDERVVFRSLSVFMGSFDVAAVECVSVAALGRDCGRVIARLARKSLLFIEHGVAPTRYRMLETMRQDSARRLRECGEEPATRLRHALYFNDLLARAHASSGQTEERLLFASIANELDNVREALEWSTNQSHNLHVAAGMCSNLCAFWENRGDFVEAEIWYRRVLACDSDLCLPETRALLHEGLGVMLYRQGLLEAARSEAKSAQRLFAENDHAQGRIRAQNLLGLVALEAGDVETARSTFERNLGDAQLLDDDAQASAGFNNLGRVLAEHDGKAEVALDHFARSNALARTIGLSTMVVASLANLSETSATLGRYSDAIEFARRGMREARDIDNRAMYGLLSIATAIYRLRLDGFPAATNEIAAALQALRNHPHRSELRVVLTAFAEALLEVGQAQRAALLVGAIAMFRNPAGSRSCNDGERHRALELRVRAALGAEVYAPLHVRGMTYAIDDALEEATRPA